MVTNKFEAVKCQACGRITRRQARLQKFCSDRCRDYARRENKARTAIKNPLVDNDSPKPTNPLFFSNKNNVLQGVKSGSSVPLNVLGGYRWPNAVRLDGDLSCKIIRAEIGAEVLHDCANI